MTDAQAGTDRLAEPGGGAAAHRDHHVTSQMVEDGQRLLGDLDRGVRHRRREPAHHAGAEEVGHSPRQLHLAGGAEHHRSRHVEAVELGADLGDGAGTEDDAWRRRLVDERSHLHLPGIRG